MWHDTLMFIAQARLIHPRIQAFFYLVASLFCIIPSKTFTSFLVSWTVLQVGVVIISVMLLALLPSLLPNIRIDLRALLRNDVFAIVKTICSVIFFNIFFLYGEFLKKKMVMAFSASLRCGSTCIFSRLIVWFILRRI